MSNIQSPKQNHLLAALPDAEYERLHPHLDLIPLKLGEVIYESGRKLQHVYFPIDSIVSLLYVMENGASAEIAVAGNEGLIGIAAFMGGETTPSRAVVQSAGYAYRLEAPLLKQEFNRSGPVQHLLLRYTQALITQMAPFHTPAEVSLLVEQFAANSSPRLNGAHKTAVSEITQGRPNQLTAEVQNLLDPLAAVAMDLHAISHSPLASDERFPLTKVHGAHRLVLDTVQGLQRILHGLQAGPIDDPTDGGAS